MDLAEQVEAFIRRNALLEPGERCVVGVSGGADSLCLLDCLHRLGYPVVIAHLDHRLRERSWQDAEYTLELARSYAVPAVVEREDVRAFAGRGRSLEEAARILRYRFLARIAQEHRARAVATGHTQDDQVETVLMHFLRGAGAAGLRGMLPSTSLAEWAGTTDVKAIRLVRPLLEVTHQQALAYCGRRGLEPREDPSNLDPSFFRNRLRHQLLPILEGYNPGLRQVLARTAKVMAAEADMVAALVAAIWDQVVREAGPEALALQIRPFRECHLALQRALVRAALRRLRPELRDIGYQAVDRAVGLVAGEGNAMRLAVPGGLELLRQGEEVILRRPGAPVSFDSYPQLTTPRQRRLDVPGALKLAAGRGLEASVVKLTPKRRAALMDGDPASAVAVDADRIATPLRVRGPRPGDRIQPLGLHGTTKVAELLVNHHIPRLARAQWPVVLSGDEIIWVAGLRMAHSPRLTPSSKRAVVLTLAQAGKE